MKCVVLIVVALLSQALALEPMMLRYHRNVGIPEAARIKAAEENLDFTGSRIVGGTPAALGEYPYFGGLLIFLRTGQISVCGSTLVTNTKLLTAAHCWTDGENTALSLEVVLGSITLFTGGVRIHTSDVETHQNFNWNTLAFDIGIITIPWTSFTNTISPITLPFGYLLWLTFVGNRPLAAGFGRTSDTSDITTSQVLSHTTLQVIPNLECEAVYGLGIIDSMMCTSGLQFRSTCGGDSGGPLALILSGIPYLIGITSFNAASGCQIGFPAGFTRVTSFVPWITARITGQGGE